MTPGERCQTSIIQSWTESDVEERKTRLPIIAEHGYLYSHIPQPTQPGSVNWSINKFISLFQTSDGFILTTNWSITPRHSSSETLLMTGGLVTRCSRWNVKWNSSQVATAESRRETFLATVTSTPGKIEVLGQGWPTFSWRRGKAENPDGVECLELLSHQNQGRGPVQLVLLVLILFVCLRSKLGADLTSGMR